MKLIKAKLLYISGLTLIFSHTVLFGAVNHWESYSNDKDCLIMTTEKLKGNLNYPSTFFFSYSGETNTMGAAVQNFEWLLKPRNSLVSFSVDSRSELSSKVSLQDNLMVITDKAFIKKFEEPFKRGARAQLLNSKNKKVAEFSLMGFTKAFDQFKKCVSSAKPQTYSSKKVVSNTKLKNNQKLSSGTEETLKFFLKAAILFAVANGDIPVSSFGAQSSSETNQIRSSTSRDLFIRPNKTGTVNKFSGSNGFSNTNIILGPKKGTTYRTIGNSIRSSNGETFRTVGNTLRSSSGETWRQVGNTIRSSSGETWRQVGNTIRSSSGTTWRQVGDTVRSSDGTTCRSIWNITRCQ